MGRATRRVGKVILKLIIGEDPNLSLVIRDVLRFRILNQTEMPGTPAGEEIYIIEDRE